MEDETLAAQPAAQKAAPSGGQMDLFAAGSGSTTALEAIAKKTEQHPTTTNMSMYLGEAYY